MRRDTIVENFIEFTAPNIQETLKTIFEETSIFFSFRKSLIEKPQKRRSKFAKRFLQAKNL